MRLISFLAFVSACTGTSPDVYAPVEVHVEQATVDPSGLLTLRYRVPLETLYSSPGLLVRRSDGGIHLQVVRCRLEATCRVDTESKLVSSVHVVALANTGGTRIFIEDEETSLPVAVSPTRRGP